MSRLPPRWRSRRICLGSPSPGPVFVGNFVATFVGERAVENVSDKGSDKGNDSEGGSRPQRAAKPPRYSFSSEFLPAGPQRDGSRSAPTIAGYAQLAEFQYTTLPLGGVSKMETTDAV